jgi:hypothetical protein
MAIGDRARMAALTGLGEEGDDRRGGSAMAVSAVNALASEAE